MSLINGGGHANRVLIAGVTREQVGETPIAIAKSATTALLRRPNSVQLPSRSGLIRPRTFWNRGSMLGLLWKLLTLFRAMQVRC